ncbi:hypothetical protein MKX01_015323 [Papaver californicum]|nr:hypothetical protein MKX01_015323 [Papaver californicum]
MVPHRLLSCFGRGFNSKTKNPTASDHHATTHDQTTEEQRRGGAVVVELFSSQGCATSPEAELLISRLGRGDFKNELDVPIMLLSFHVDYWDYMGWKDPFGSSQWTVRQKGYIEALKLDTMFTPQIVIQGTTQCVGTDQDSVLSNIRSAPRYPSPTLQATFERPSADTLQVSLSGSLRAKIDGRGVDVMVALYENGLVTDCPKGENKGRVLANDFVVRRFEMLCTVKDISSKKTINGTVHLTLWEGFNSSKCGVAVFIQNSSLQTFGAQNFQLPENL